MNKRFIVPATIALWLFGAAGLFIGLKCAPDDTSRADIAAKKEIATALRRRTEERRETQKEFAARDTKFRAQQQSANNAMETRTAAIARAKAETAIRETDFEETRKKRRGDETFIFKNGDERDLLRRLNLLLGECGGCPTGARDD